MTQISSLERQIALPTNLRWQEFTCAIVELPGGIDFLDLSVPEQRLMASLYPCGLAFGEESELRWLTRANGLLHLVYISDVERNLGPGSDPHPLAQVHGGEPTRLVLWGERQKDGTYYENRIPRVLRYPASPWEPGAGGRLAVELRHYELEDESLGIPMFRCVRLIAVEDRT